jgi:hypothetical protein
VALARVARAAVVFCAARGVRLSWGASFLKDFVVVKDFPRYHAENPSQQQKFT